MGPGVEIEEDIIRLRRRKLEYEADAARRTGPRRLRILLLGKAMPAVSAGAAIGGLYRTVLRRGVSRRLPPEPSRLDLGLTVIDRSRDGHGRGF
jgi:hypothetical protein